MSPDINLELEKITWASHLIFQFPLWWFSMPAILKGWFDRTFIKGFAYDAGLVFEKGLLKGKKASLVVSTQSGESAYQLNGIQKATIDTFLHHIHHTLHFVGIESTTPFVSYAAYQLSPFQVDKMLDDYTKYLMRLFQTNLSPLC